MSNNYNLDKYQMKNHPIQSSAINIYQDAHSNISSIN